MVDHKEYRIEGSTGLFEVVIGLEVHAQVVSAAKLFSGAATTFGAEPNTQVSLIDAGFPGMLPVINERCVEQAVRTGLGLKAEINLTSIFDRKNYFYADLPSGYQITQYQHPIVGRGEIQIELPGAVSRTIGITRLHLETDAGKSLHDQHPTLSYIDLNRAGVALMEIVSEPELRSPEEVGAYLKKLRSILRYLGTCDGNMEESSMRCDCNVSVRRPGDVFGTRCEIKNVNSIRYAMQAVEFEARRHVSVLEAGGTIAQETRLFDPSTGSTRAMRSKEDAHDYRYFPDPDLLPLVLDPQWVEEIRASMPELPDEKRARFLNQYGLSAYDAEILCAERGLADFFEAVAAGRDAKSAANWVTGELFAALNRRSVGIENSPISAEALGELLDLIADDTVSGTLAKEVFLVMSESGKSAATIIDEKDLRQVTDAGAIESAVDVVLAAQPDKVAQYRAGKERLLGFFVGLVMKETKGKAKPTLVNELLLRKLAG